MKGTSVPNTVIRQASTKTTIPSSGNTPETSTTEVVTHRKVAVAVSTQTGSIKSIVTHRLEAIPIKRAITKTTTTRRAPEAAKHTIPTTVAISTREEATKTPKGS